VDHFVFHQANAHMIDHLRKRLDLPREKVVLALTRYGNTVSSTIPIALRDASREGAFRSGERIMLIGFGVGFSWGATLIRWP
jgi:3-oxoacyl-[acyl-carrier-protein] synthase-3